MARVASEHTEEMDRKVFSEEEKKELFGWLVLGFSIGFFCLVGGFGGVFWVFFLVLFHF